MQHESLKAEETEAQMKLHAGWIQPSYSLARATGSVPDVPALLPCEQEPSGEDDGYSSTRTRRYTAMLDVFPHQWHRIRLSGDRSFSLPFGSVTKNQRHLLFVCDICHQFRSDKLKWEGWIIHSNCTSEITEIWLSLRSGEKTLSKRPMSHTLCDS